MKFNVEITDTSLMDDGILDRNRTAEEIMTLLKEALPFEVNVTNHRITEFWLSEGLMSIMESLLLRDITNYKYERTIGVDIGWATLDTLENLLLLIKNKKKEVYEQ